MVKAEDTVLRGCEILCLTGDLIACPLSSEEQEVCKSKLQYLAGEKEMFKKIRQALRGEFVVFDYVLDGVEIEWLHTKLRKMGIVNGLG